MYQVTSFACFAAPLIFVRMRAPLQVPRSCQCLLMSATTSADLERLQALVLHNPLALDLLALPDADAAAGAAAGTGSAIEIEHFSLPCAE